MIPVPAVYPHSMPGLGQFTCADGSSPDPTTGLCASGASPSVAAQIATVLTAAGGAATQAVNAANAPAGYVYNAATGRYVPAVGAFGLPGVSTTVGISGSLMLPLIAIALVGVVLLMMRK